MAVIERIKKLLKTESTIDKTSSDSFPASDAPAYSYPGASLPASEAAQTQPEILEHPQENPVYQASQSNNENQTHTFMDEATMVNALNKILEQEHACAIRYATHAAVINGPYAETVAARLREIAQDEIDHAEKLRERIIHLGGTPSMALSDADLKYADTLEEIININMDEELQAIREYEVVFKATHPENVILYQTLQELIRDEQEHLEELQNLLPNNNVKS